jgi:hypothetical protein
MEKDMLARYVPTYPHIGCGCKLEREGDTIVFGFTDSDNEKRGSAPYRPTLVVGPLLADFIHSRWNSLALGDTVEFLIPVVNIQRWPLSGSPASMNPPM